MSLPQPAESAITKAASALTYGGSGSAAVFGLTPSEWSVIGIIGGLAIALAGFFVNVWFKRAQLALAAKKVAADLVDDE